MINIIIEKIVTDQRQHDTSDDFSSTFGMAVGTVLQNFNDLSRLKGIEIEADDLKNQYKNLATERDALQSEVQKLRILPSQMEHQGILNRNEKLIEENNSLRDLLKKSKETIALLQQHISDDSPISATSATDTTAKISLKLPPVKNAPQNYLERRSMDERVRFL
jgi:DNA repair ATPase RecN